MPKYQKLMGNSRRSTPHPSTTLHRTHLMQCTSLALLAFNCSKRPFQRFSHMFSESRGAYLFFFMTTLHKSTNCQQSQDCARRCRAQGGEWGRCLGCWSASWPAGGSCPMVIVPHAKQAYLYTCSQKRTHTHTCIKLGFCRHLKTILSLKQKNISSCTSGQKLLCLLKCVILACSSKQLYIKYQLDFLGPRL